MPGNYTLTFWAQVKEFDICHDCCAIMVVTDGEVVDESPGYYQLSVQSEWTQFIVNLGPFNTPTTAQIDVSSVNCYVQNLWMDDFGLVLS
jgi:hypothetical protein